MIIDISNEVFTSLKTSLSDIQVSLANSSSTPIFPCLLFEEFSNNTKEDTHDSAGDQHCEGSFQLTIITSGDQKISIAKGIRDRADAIMSEEYNMVREDSRPVKNVADPTLYRYVLRYSYIIDSNKTIYRR